MVKEEMSWGRAMGFAKERLRCCERLHCWAMGFYRNESEDDEG